MVPRNRFGAADAWPPSASLFSAAAWALDAHTAAQIIQTSDPALLGRPTRCGGAGSMFSDCSKGARIGLDRRFRFRGTVLPASPVCTIRCRCHRKRTPDSRYLLVSARRRRPFTPRTRLLRLQQSLLPCAHRMYMQQQRTNGRIHGAERRGAGPPQCGGVGVEPIVRAQRGGAEEAPQCDG
jgi:hypothetical protein